MICCRHWWPIWFAVNRSRSSQPSSAAQAAKAATATIPIVFISGSDPIETGLVTSLNRPSENVTGVSLFSVPLIAKRLELLHEVIPAAAVVAVLVNPTNPNAEANERAN